MEQQKFYPAISTLVSLDDLPPMLGFLNEQLGPLLDTTFFKNLQHSRSGKGGRAFYSLTLLRYEKFGFAIPGTGIDIVFNSPTTSTFTEIPVTLAYQWGILDLLGSIKLENFIDDAKQLFSLIARKFDIDPMKVARQAIDQFAGVPGQLSALIADVNTRFGKSLQMPTSGTPQQMLEEVLGDIEDQLELPSLEVLYTLYIAPLNDAREAIKRVEQLFKDVFAGKSVVEFLREMLIPKVDATIRTSIGIEFPRSILVPVDASDQPKPGNVRSVLSLGDIDFYFSTTRGIGFDTALSGTLDRSMIGNTGLIIEFEDVKLDISTTTNISEATADGRGPDFVGVFVKRAEISLPKFWKTKPDAQRPADPAKWARIVARNVLAGTGGLSGQFALEPTTDEPVLETWFGARDASAGGGGAETGFGIALDRFDIHFHQGSITHSNIEGTLTIPGLKLAGGLPAEIRVQITIDKKGFKIAGTFPDVTIGIPNIFNFTFNRVAIGKSGDRFFLETGGKLDITAQIPALNQRFIDKPMDIQKLVIWSDGEFDFEGGSLVLPTIAPLKVGPVELSVTALHFGRDRQPHNGAMREYKMIGFDGGVKSGPGGVDARGEGIKFYYTVDDDNFGGASHRFLRVETIRIDLRIPGDATPETAALLLKGYISMKNPTALSPGGAGQTRSLTEFAGGVTFRLPKLEMGGGAELRMIPSIGAFLVDAHLEMSTPILLGSTGLGIYGFRGVFGNKYVLERPPNTSWWEFYKQPELGIHPPKFTQKDGFSVGAGVSLATAADSGTTFSSKLFFMLSVPTVFMLEGQAAILSKRVGLDTKDDPPFYAMLAIEAGVGVEAGFGAKMHIPQDSGDVLKLDAALEMGFFFGNASAWYVNIGRDQPASKRIHATIVRILEGWAYFMLASSGIKAGAGVEWKFEQDCGIAKVGIGASLEVGGRASFKPTQIGAWIILQGYAELKVFGIGFRLSVRASLTVEAPNPFIICGSFELEIKTPWPFPDVRINVNLCWRFRQQQNLSEIGMLEPPESSQWNVGACPTPDIKLPAKATHMLTNDSFPINFLKRSNTLHSNPPGPAPDASIPAPTDPLWAGKFESFAIPLDCWIDIEFTKGVAPNLDNDDIKKLAPPQTATVNHELVPPQRGISDQVKHSYIVERVSLYTWSPTANQWWPLDMLEASTPILEMVAQTNVTLYESDRNAALAWAKTQIGAKMKYGFWQLTQANSLTKLRLLARTAFEQNPEVKLTELGFPPKVIVCPPVGISMTCHNWLDLPIDTPFPLNREVTDRKLRFTVTGDNPQLYPVVAPHTGTLPFGFNRSLWLRCGSRIEFRFPFPVGQVKMKLSTNCGKLDISYHNGEVMLPKPVALNPEGGPVAQWDIAPVGVAPATPNDDTWDKLHNIPSYLRAFGDGQSVDMNLEPVQALDTAMTTTFRKTNIHLRELWGLPAPDPNGSFTDRLRENLEVVAAAVAGKESPPVAQTPAIETFYRDAGRYAAEYVQLQNRAGETIAEPPALQNAFYEKWLDVIACLGKAYEERGALPPEVQAILKEADLEIERLYFIIRSIAASRDMRLNQSAEVSDPMQRLRMAGEFFSILSLTLTEGNIPSALIGDLESYYSRLDALAIRLRAALNAATGSACTASGGILAGGVTRSDIGAVNSCNRLDELQGIVRLMCAGSGPLVNSATQPVINAITALVANFAGVKEELEGRFGWESTAFNGVFCHDLGLVLALIGSAWGSFDGLPGELRVGVQEFHGKLRKLVDDYRNATAHDELPALPTDEGEFLDRWSAALSCLCRICQEMGSLTSDEQAFFTSTIDPLIDKLHRGVVGAGADEFRSFTGTVLPADNCALITNAISFLTALSMKCGEQLAWMESWLDDKLLDFTFSYGDTPVSGFKDGAVFPYIGTLCNGSAIGNACEDWLETLECLENLIARRGSLPQSIIDRIVADFDDLLHQIADKADSLYGDLGPWPAFDTPVESTEFSVRYILGHILGDCLQGNGPDPALQALLTGGGELEQLDDAFTALRIALGALPTSERITLCASPRRMRSDRQRELLEIYRKLCNTPPPIPALGTPPLSEIVFAIRNSTALLAELAAVLNLPAPPADWDLEEFPEVLAQVIQLLIIAYGMADTLPLALESRLNAFFSLIKIPADSYSGGSPDPLPGCQTTCNDFLERLFCMAKVCRYRRYLPEEIFTGDPSSLEEAMGEHLADLASAGILWRDLLGLGIMPGGSVDRCRKVKTIIGYFGSKASNYDNLPSLMPLFNGVQGLVDALGSMELQGVKSRLCAGTDTGDDPLRGRTVVTAGDLGNPVEYNDPDNPIDRVVITPAGCPGSGCMTFVHEICWLSAADLEFNSKLPSDTVVLETNNSVIYGLKMMTQTIWRPNTIYALQIETHEVINDRRGDPYRKVFTFGFQTNGPVGHFHAYDVPGKLDNPQYYCRYKALRDADQEAAFQYAKLKQYVDYQRSYPNADGNIIGAKPLYYVGSKLQLFYIRDYISSMYSPWNSYEGMPETRSGMQVVIRDPGRPADPQYDIVIDPLWHRDTDPHESRDKLIFKYMVSNNGGCLVHDPIDVTDKPPARLTKVPLTLEPRRLYTALFNAIMEVGAQPRQTREVHKYVFQTSRYAGFGEHINSYQLGGTERAFYAGQIPDAEAAMAKAILSGTRPGTPPEAAIYDALVAQYADPFDRLVDGALKLGTLPAPATTEFTVIRSGTGGTMKILGVLLRSPEPFNDPKLPLDELRLGLSATQFPGAATIIFAKDVSRVFVTNAAMNVAPGDVTFRFEYRLFDGKQFGTATTITNHGTPAEPDWQEAPVPPVTVTLTI